MSAAQAQPAGVAANPARNAAARAAKADPRADIVKKIDGIKLEDVRMSPVNGIYEVTRGAEISYLLERWPLRHPRRHDRPRLRREPFREPPPRHSRAHDRCDSRKRDAGVLAQGIAKYTITVFTDIDCGYCRRLHSQIAEYNRLGIRVRYLFFPRSGPDTESWHKAEAVWCASNRNDALTRAKNGEDIKSPKCPTDIIERDFELGQKLAVEGTPAIFLPSGEMLAGYAPPAQLAKYLKTGKM